MNNDLLNYYQNYLQNDKKAGKATIKNYIADVRRFITWYEARFQLQFNPKAVSKELASQYLAGEKSQNISQLPIASASSLKRYASSLRKFYIFLIDHELAYSNPFKLNQPQVMPADPWHLKEFNNFLFLSDISKVTRKNYMIDIRQFSEWAQEVMTGAEMPVEASVLGLVTTSMVEEYKNRLLREANLSPVSINRKLSSLRKYFNWANEQKLLKSSIAVASETTPVVNLEPTPFPIAASEVQPQQVPLSLEDLRNLEPQEEEIIPREKKYSSFAPIRLFQKTSGIISLGLGALILGPIDKTAELVRYSYWKLSGRKVFGTIEEVIGTATPIATSEAVNQLQAANPGIQAAKTAKIIALLGRKLGIPSSIAPQFKGFPKSFYAPLSISTQNLPWTKKVWHHLRHTRPAWYYKYHSYPLVHYIHYGILLAATSMIGLHVYTTLANQARIQESVTAVPAASPPRTLVFQGKLNDASNTPITAESNLRFAIYKSPIDTGARQLWQEEQTIKPNAEGSFRAVLGKKTTLRQDLFTENPSLYLGISVNGGKELQPRQPLANVTNAANANSLQGLKPITEINAGTRNVVLALDSSGNLTIGGSASPVFQATGGELTLSGQILSLKSNTGSNGNIQIAPDGAGFIDMQKGIQNTTNYSSIPSAAGAVSVDDLFAVNATSSGQSAFTINQNGAGPIISASAGGIAKFTLDNQGNGFFGGNISIQGNTLSSTANSFTLLNSPINITLGGSASSLTLGASTGTTTINNSLKVKGISTFDGAVNSTGLITANGGLSIPTGQSLKLNGFKPGSIPFINDNNQLATDSANLYWDAANKRFGIGTTAPASKLAIADLGTGAGTALVIDDSGNVFRASSSRRYKDDIKPLSTNPLLLLNTAPVSFRYKNTGTYDIGYMAEDLDMLGLKDLVIYDKEGRPDAIKYDKLSIYILELVKQQHVAIETLKETVDTIKLGYIEAQQITTNSISNISENIMIGSKTLKEYIASAINNKEQSNTTDSNSPTATNPVASASAIADQTISEQTTTKSSTSASLVSPSASSAADMLSNTIELQNTTASISAVASSSAIASSSALPLEPKSPLYQPGNVVNIKYEGANTNYADIASFSADLAFVPNLKSDFATFNQGLIALGPASLTDVGVSGKLSVGGNLQIETNSINTIGSDLNLQSLRQGNLSIMGGLVVIDTEGNLNVEGIANFAKDVNIKGKLAAGIIAPVPQEDLIISLPEKDAQTGSSLLVKNATGSAVLAINQKGDVVSSGAGKFASVESKGFKIIRGAQADTSLTETTADGSAGTGVITAYERERTIRTPYVTAKSLIYVTATSDTQKATPYIARQTANSFTVQIPTTVTKDISFNWWIIN